MSTLKVEIVTIDNIQPHPNADKLELATVINWVCVVQKGKFFVGDTVIYIPIDSVLPQPLIDILFGPDSKIKLNNGRIKTIKLRGAVSQGLIVDPGQVGLSGAKLGSDVAKILNITKYEPPEVMSPRSNALAAPKRDINSNFKKYTDIENAKNHKNVFLEGEFVSVTEKVHGSNWRCGYVPTQVNTVWRKIKSLLGLLPKFEFVYGSHNVQLQNKGKGAKQYHKIPKGNIYSEAIDKYNIKDILKEGEVLYGEVYGDGIQKGFTYGCKTGERDLVIFDVMVNGRYLDAHDARKFCRDRGLPFVPELYVGGFFMDRMKELTKGPSVLFPGQPIREGIVIKPLKESTCHVGRKVLKLISDDYLLLKDNTDWH